MMTWAITRASGLKRLKLAWGISKVVSSPRINAERTNRGRAMSKSKMDAICVAYQSVVNEGREGSYTGRDVSLFASHENPKGSSQDLRRYQKANCVEGDI